MFSKLISFWRGQPVAVTLFLAALGITAFFAFRSIAFTIYWSDPAHRDQEILSWMTPRYVAHSWNIAPESLHGSLGIRKPPDRPKSLAEFAEEQDITFEVLKERIEATIAEERAKKLKKK